MTLFDRLDGLKGQWVRLKTIGQGESITYVKITSVHRDHLAGEIEARLTPRALLFDAIRKRKAILKEGDRVPCTVVIPFDAISQVVHWKEDQKEEEQFTLPAVLHEDKAGEKM